MRSALCGGIASPFSFSIFRRSALPPNAPPYFGLMPVSRADSGHPFSPPSLALAAPVNAFVNEGNPGPAFARNALRSPPVPGCLLPGNLYPTAAYPVIPQAELPLDFPAAAPRAKSAMHSGTPHATFLISIRPMRLPPSMHSNASAAVFHPAKASISKGQRVPSLSSQAFQACQSPKWR